MKKGLLRFFLNMQVEIFWYYMFFKSSTSCHCFAVNWMTCQTSKWSVFSKFIYFICENCFLRRWKQDSWKNVARKIVRRGKLSKALFRSSYAPDQRHFSRSSSAFLICLSIIYRYLNGHTSRLALNYCHVAMFGEVRTNISRI